MNQARDENLVPLDHHLDGFVRRYNELNKSNLSELSELYTPDVTFVDPIHEIKGLDALTEYFEHLYENMLECEFSVFERFHNGSDAAIYWQMKYSHKKINRGRLVKVEGHSHLKFIEGKVHYHRDYYDLGELLYEQLPLIGSVVKTIKSKASS